MAARTQAQQSSSAALDDVAAEWVMRQDAGLSPADDAAFQAWLAASASHREAFARWEALWSQFDRPFDSGQMAPLREQLARRLNHRRRQRAIGVAAAMAVAIGGATLWRQAPWRSNEAGAAVATSAVLLPERRVLMDGSVVELREGAEFAVDYSPRVRRISLTRGQAHFEVTPDPARPFFVVAAGVEVRAVGTAFSVQRERKSVSVLVTHGRVAVHAERAGSDATTAVSPVSNHPDEAPAPLAVLDAGKGVVVEVGAPPDTVGVVAVPSAEFEPLLAWRAPRVEFTGATLAEAVELLNLHAGRRNGLRLVIGDPSIAAERVSGLFRLDRTEAFVGLLENGFGITAERRGAGELVLQRPR